MREKKILEAVSKRRRKAENSGAQLHNNMMWGEEDLEDREKKDDEEDEEECEECSKVSSV